MAFQSLIIYSQCIGFAHTLLSFCSLFPLTSCQNLKNWLLNQAEKFKRPKFCLITFHIMSHLWQTMLIYFFESKILLSVQNNGLGFLRHCLEIDKDRIESQKKIKQKRGVRNPGKKWGRAEGKKEEGSKERREGGRKEGRRVGEREEWKVKFEYISLEQHILFRRVHQRGRLKHSL